MKSLFPILLLLLTRIAFTDEGAYFSPEIIDRTPTKQEKTPSNNISTKVECINKNGEWFENKKYDYRYCIIPYPDAGKLCKNSNDCMGHCVWPLNEKTLDDKSLPSGYGICQLDDSTDDCGRPHFDNGNIIYFNCD